MRHFAKGSGCYECISCHRRTRAVDPDAADIGLCAECFELSCLENMVSDGNATENDLLRIEQLGEIIKTKSLKALPPISKQEARCIRAEEEMGHGRAD